MSDVFTRNVEVISLTRSGTTITARCDDAHGLKSGNAVSIVGARTPIVISSIDRTLTIATLVTAADHDLTEPVAPTITISGAAEAEFNGTFKVLSIPNRRTISFKVANSGPASGSGPMILEDGESFIRSYNTMYRVDEILNQVEFTFQQTDATLPNPLGTITARARARISKAVDPERAIAAYTEQAIGDAWMFVVLEDVNASKDRSSREDGISRQSKGDEFRQPIVQPFTLYVFLPVSDDISGVAAGRDQAEDLFRPICQSVLFKSFNSGLFASEQGLVHFFGHRTFQVNPAVYVHSFSFEQTVDLTVDDTVGPADDVAFRQIELTMFPDVGVDGTGVESMTSSIDLDDTQL